ncbi:hypothetical protein [Microcoleus sp. herbarium5]|uniref:hypothetical protein n=1 Tax=Microcoleus sp. herbarium5 TaxID=3055434 RepID=UPI002FD6A7D8
MLSRVVQQNPLAQRVGQFFNQTYSKFGVLSDDDVRESSVQAKEAKEQVKKSRIFAKNLATIEDCQKEIEELALEAINHGFKTNEAIVKFIANGLRAAGKHEAALAYEQASLNLDLSVIKAESTSKIGLKTVETQSELALILKKYGIQSKAITAKYTEIGVSYEHQFSLSASLDKQLAIQSSQKEAYWKGEPVGRASASVSKIGGFFSNLFGRK